MKKVLAEAALVAFLGLTFSLIANGLSPRGLKLTRNYFPGAPRPPSPGRPVVTPGTNSTHAMSPAQAAAEAALARLRQKGFQVVDDEKILSLFHDPRYEQGLVIFIDARKDEEYRQGHIPGAYQLDPMPPSPEKYLAGVIGPCNIAQEIVVYCHGGDCELSEFAAELLRSANIPNEKIFIYANGIPSWQARGLPLETGDRKSGQISNPHK